MIIMATLGSVVSTFCVLLNEKKAYNANFGFLSQVMKKRKHDDDLVAAVAVYTHRPSNKRPKIKNYCECVVPRYNDLDFKSHFRLCRESVEFLLTVIPIHGNESKGQPSLAEVNKEKIVLLSLWTLGNQESFRGIADRFGVDRGHAHRLFMSFCKAMAELLEKFITWPIGEKAVETVRDFQTLRGFNSFPNVIGCVDGTLIEVTMAKKEKQEYFCRKQFTAVILQGICKMEFIDVFVGWPGSAHDARVWRNSPIFQKISSDESFIPANCHILGDSAYPLQTYLMVPFKDNGHLSRREKFFNKRLSSSRVVIEQAYGDLFGRFRRLKYLHIFNKQYIALIVVTACILHNFCRVQNDETPDIDDNFMQNNNEAPLIPLTNSAASAKRNAIADCLFA